MCTQCIHLQRDLDPRQSIQREFGDLRVDHENEMGDAPTKVAALSQNLDSSPLPSLRQNWTQRLVQLARRARIAEALRGPLTVRGDPFADHPDFPLTVRNRSASSSFRTVDLLGTIPCPQDGRGE